MDKFPPNSNERKRRDELATVANEIEWLSREALELIQKEGGILRDENILLYARINGLSHRLILLSVESGAKICPIERPMRRLR